MTNVKLHNIVKSGDLSPMLYYHLIVKEDMTIRKIASRYGISKTKVHRDIHTYVKDCLSSVLFRDIQNKLDNHFATKYINGAKISANNRRLRKHKMNKVSM